MKITESKVDNIVSKSIEQFLHENTVFVDDNGGKQNSGFVNPEGVEGLEPITYDYLINRHKGLPEEYFEPTDIQYDPNEFAMYTIPSDVDLKEGLSKTYPTKKALDFVCANLTKRGYPIKPNNFNVNCPNDDKTIYGHITLMVVLNYLNQEINDTLISSFKTCGYYLGKTFNRIDRQGNMCVVFQFEPKFQTNVTNTDVRNFLYHVTTANAARKIMQQGFCPSNRTKNGFKYDGRCYFFTVYDKNLFVNYMKEARKKNMTGKNIFNNDFEVITIDRSLINNVDFFCAPNFQRKIAVFTYSNIPPSAIVKQEKL